MTAVAVKTIPLLQTFENFLLFLGSLSLGPVGTSTTRLPLRHFEDRKPSGSEFVSVISVGFLDFACLGSVPSLVYVQVALPEVSFLFATMSSEVGSFSGGALFPNFIAKYAKRGTQMAF